MADAAVLKIGVGHALDVAGLLAVMRIRQVDHQLGEGNRFRVECDEAGGELADPLEKLVGGKDVVHLRDRLGLVGIDVPAGECDPLGPVGSDQAGQPAYAATARDDADRISGRPKYVSGVQNRKSQDTASSVPAPRQGPFAAMSTGFSICSISS